MNLVCGMGSNDRSTLLMVKSTYVILVQKVDNVFLPYFRNSITFFIVREPSYISSFRTSLFFVVVFSLNGR